MTVLNCNRSLEWSRGIFLLCEHVPSIRSVSSVLVSWYCVLWTGTVSHFQSLQNLQRLNDRPITHNRSCLHRAWTSHHHPFLLFICIIINILLNEYNHAQPVCSNLYFVKIRKKTDWSSDKNEEAERWKYWCAVCVRTLLRTETCPLVARKR